MKTLTLQNVHMKELEIIQKLEKYILYEIVWR